MADKKLFESFLPVRKEQWIKQVVKDLKGKSFETSLTYTTQDGIVVSPFYTKEDFPEGTEFKPLFNHTDWDVCAEIDGTNEEEGNKQMLFALNTGATSLLCYVYASANLTVLCNQVQLQHIHTQFVVEGDATVFVNNLNGYLKQQSIETETQATAVNIDPVEQLLRTGNWRKSNEADAHELQQVIEWNGTLCINGNIYQQAGAPQAYEIGCILAHANMLVQDLLNHPASINTIQLNIAIGADYFFEIAKLRALRKVFSLFCQEHGIKAELLIHAETSSLNMTLFDEYNNSLRATTAAMAASIGGSNSLFIKPFDMLRHTRDKQAERLSRNIQLILKEESYLNQMADIAAGAYFIEYLTEQLAEKAWGYFTAIEKAGGFFENLKQGTIQQQINDYAAAQQQAFNLGETVLVGSNKFPNPKDDVNVSGNFFNEPKPNTSAIVRQIFPFRLAANNEQERLNKQGVHS